MRPRRREAVSDFVAQIGLSTATMSAVLISSTLRSRIGRQ